MCCIAGGNIDGAASAPNVTALESRIDRLELAQSAQVHKGVTTSAGWVRDCRNCNVLRSCDPNFAALLTNVCCTGWVAAGNTNIFKFPDSKCLESGVGGTQEYVTAMFETFQNGKLSLHNPAKTEDCYLKNEKTTLQFSCYPDIGAHERPSFGTRKPDNVHRCGQNETGAHSIVMLGDNKRRADGSFTDEEVGHVLDLGSQLLWDHQKRRRKLYCYLTDGYRFQFFQISRNTSSLVMEMMESNVYTGVLGWQVGRIGAISIPQII